MFVGFHVKPSTVAHIIGWILAVWWIVLCAMGAINFSKLRWPAYLLFAITLALIAV